MEGKAAAVNSTGLKQPPCVCVTGRHAWGYRGGGGGQTVTLRVCCCQSSAQDSLAHGKAYKHPPANNRGVGDKSLLGVEGGGAQDGAANQSEWQTKKQAAVEASVYTLLHY